MSSGIPIGLGNAADVPALMKKLAEPFPAGCVGWKPTMVKNGRAIALAYIDARDVQNRLDEVFQVDGWEDAYQVLADGSVCCTLRVRFGDRWVSKTDVGSQSEQPDGGDRMKAAFSDALKRVAVKFGIGRYLYYLDTAWADYDPQRKKLAPPQLPAWALPGGTGRPPAYGPPPYAVHLAPDDPHAKPAPPPANGKPKLTLPQLVAQLRTKTDPADGAELSSRVGWLAVQFGKLIPAFDPADLDAAIGDALDLAESWKYETLPADAVRRAWRVVVDYADKSHQTAGVS